MTTTATERTRQATRRRTPLVALYTANAVSSTSDVLMFLAVPWFVLQTASGVARTYGAKSIDLY